MTLQKNSLPTIEELFSSIRSYFPEADLSIVQKAFEYSEKKHSGQKRSSGEDYITHPLAVAIILSKMKLDIASICAALLHDTVEDTEATLDEIKKEFGQEISALVDGVTKIGKINFKSSHEKQAENYRKMILAMASDLRVILVKLADRTHNMRTLGHVKEEKSKRIAQETLEIYAPIANRLGIAWVKTELEDLSLKYLKPEIYSKLSKLVAQKKGEREKYIHDLIKILSEKIENYGLNASVLGRAKHFYSIFKKMESKQIEFDEIHDLVAFRILTKKMSECYEVLGIVHSFFKPVPGRFKDYIAMPKNNMYQSLHTTVIGPFGERLEIQIRTNEMNQVADSGIAAHWEYKSGKINQKDSEKFHWLRKLVENHDTLDNPSEYLESIKLDLFEQDIYIFSPNGELFELPVNATPLDFAYTIHTNLGHKCSGAKVNGRIVPLKHKLRSGDTVEIITSSTQKPTKDWVKIVKSSRAKAKIRAYIRAEERESVRKLGFELLDREFKSIEESLAKFEKRKDLQDIISSISYASYDELLIHIGYGKVDPDKISQKLFPEKKLLSDKISEKKDSSTSTKTKNQNNRPIVRVAGLKDDILVRFAKCCNPLPGDEIIGYISRGKGVVVHKLDCKKILDFDPDRSLNVIWEQGNTTGYLFVKIKVVCRDEPGLLNKMSKTITDLGINIRSLNIKVNSDKRATGTFDIEVKNKSELTQCVRKLESIEGIITVDRI